MYVNFVIDMLGSEVLTKSSDKLFSFFYFEKIRHFSTFSAAQYLVSWEEFVSPNPELAYK